MTTKQVPTETVKVLPQAIVEAIVAGHLGHEVEKVTISAKTSPTKKDEEEKFDALYALDAEGMAILCAGRIEPQETVDGKKTGLGACDHFNYGRILGVRQNVRTALEGRLEGPDKMIAKQVKALHDGGTFDSEAEARTFVIERLKAKGAIPADYA